MKGKVIWFYGVSCSGKTTFADMLSTNLESKNIPVQRLDGDIIRTSLSKGLGFDRNDIAENIRRVCFVADLLSSHGITVIASFITPYLSDRLYLKEHLGNRLILILIHTKLQTCIRRDTKGIYKNAMNREIENLAGFTSPFELSNQDNNRYIFNEGRTIEESFEKLLEQLKGINYEI